MNSAPEHDEGEAIEEAQEAIDRTPSEAEETRQTSPGGGGAGDEDLVEGSVEVLVAPPIVAALRARLEDSVRTIPDLRLVTAGGSASGIRIIVFASRPLPLATILGGLPFVSHVEKQTARKVTRFVVTLATPG